VSSLDKARAPKCKEIAHVICTKPPFKKKTLEKEVCPLRKQLKKEKKRKKRKREETKSREKLKIPLFPLPSSSSFLILSVSVWFLRHFVSYFAPFCLQWYS